MTREELQHLVGRIAPAIARDPRPRATIRVGAIGHRNIENDVREHIVHTVKNIFDLIRQAAEDALKKADIKEQFVDGLDLVVVSPIAEGADRLIAQAGLDQNFRLGAILPFNVRDYEATFDLGDAGASIEEFRTLFATAELPNGYGILVLDGESAEGDRRDASIMLCADAVTRWSDILIAILSEGKWNSQTGQSVRRAIDMGVPVILIDPKLLESFQLHTDTENSDQYALDLKLRLHDLVVSLLAPSAGPANTSEKAARPSSSFGLAGYCGERVESDVGRNCEFEYDGPYRAKMAAPVWARSCSGLNRWIEKRIARLLTRPVNWEPIEPSLWDLPFDRATIAPIIELYLRYHRADVVANAYAELQRSVQIVIALLGVATVAFAALAAQTGGDSVIFAGLELACLVFALSFVLVSHRQAWLDRWLDCRLLAEIFRYSKFLLMTGLASPFGDLRGSHAAMEGERTWARDHAQDVLRAHRLAIPGRGAEVESAAIGLIANYSAAQCIEGQARYHWKTGYLRLKQAQALKTAGVIASITTFVLVGAKFVLELLLARHLIADVPLLHAWRKVGDVAAIILPALTAGLLALRAFGELDVVGLRSLAMMKALEREKHLVKDAPGMQILGDEMLRIARMLLHDVDGWRELFSGKHLES